MDCKLQSVLKYAESLEGIKYLEWTNTSNDINNIFYFDKPESYDILSKNGVNCSGLINLLMHFSGYTMPKSISKIRGGTGFWFNYFKKKKILKKFNYKNNYKIGTLFLRKYRNLKDQGHFAVLFSRYQNNDSFVLNGKIIHACQDFGVCKTVFGYSHFYNNNENGYYEYFIEPENWLQL